MLGVGRGVAHYSLFIVAFSISNDGPASSETVTASAGQIYLQEEEQGEEEEEDKEREERDEKQCR